MKIRMKNKNGNKYDEDANNTRSSWGKENGNQAQCGSEVVGRNGNRNKMWDENWTWMDLVHLAEDRKGFRELIRRTVKAPHGV